MDVRSGNIELVINEVRLEGFEQIDRAVLAAAVQRELAPLVARAAPPALSDDDAHTSSIDGEAFTLGSTTGADSTAAHIAQAVNRGLAQ